MVEKRLINSPFNPVSIESTTLDDTWFKLLRALWFEGRKGEIITSGSFAGSRRLYFDDISGFIHYPHQRPLAPIIPEGIPKASSPTTDEKIEDYFSNYLMNSELAEDEEYNYATWIVGGSGNTTIHNCFFDQIHWIIDHFKKHGYSNEHCYLTIGNPWSNQAYDKPYKECQNKHCEDYRTSILHKHEVKNCPRCGYDLVKNEAKRGTSPCLRGLDFAIRTIEGINFLTTKVIYRSWDLVSAWPENMGGFTLVNEYVASNLENVEPGPLSYSCKSLHAYDHAIKPLKGLLHIDDENENA